MALFNRNLIEFGKSIEPPDNVEIENTLNLRQASLEDAARYGGTITRASLGAMSFVGDRKYIVVDTKVNYLMKGFIPAIPGWHTDGVPRGEELDPAGKGIPMLSAQEQGLVSSSRYHLLVTGTLSQTEFIVAPLELNLPDTRDLYERMTRAVDSTLVALKYSARDAVLVAPESRVLTWDWWNIHRAVPANKAGWRYLIRVTETDYIAPRTDPSDFIRTQTQVYVPTAFGW